MTLKNRQIAMTLMFFSFLTIIISMVVIDGVWLSLMLKRFYAPHIGQMLSESMSIWPAVVFYILFAIALNVFVVLPGLKNNTGYLDLWLLGILFGLATYGTYDLTNQATLKNWPWALTVVDMAWGGCLTGAVTLISTFIARRFW